MGALFCLSCSGSLTCQDGQEILSVNDVQKTYEKILQEGGEKKARYETVKLSPQMTVVLQEFVEFFSDTHTSPYGE